MKSVSLLCRGESLKYINDISPADQCVLVNAFHHELEINDIHIYVSNCKIVTHVLSPGAFWPEAGALNIYKNYNFNKIVLPYIKQCSPSIPHSMQNLKVPIEYLSDINKEDMVKTPRYEFTAPTTGLDALLYCVNQLKPDLVNIIGLDFYDTSGYFTNSHGRDRREIIDRNYAIKRGEPTDKMQEFFIKIIKKNLDMQFNLYTRSDIKYKSKNLKVNYYE